MYHLGQFNVIKIVSNTTPCQLVIKGKGTANPVVLDRPWGFQEVKAARLQDNRHMKVVRLSALSSGRFYPADNITDIHFY